MFDWKINLALGSIEAAQFYTITVPNLEHLAPQALYVEEGLNAKEDIQSYSSGGREQSANHPHQRTVRRQGKVKTKAALIANEEATIRLAKETAGIFLCPARCQSSLHYCRKEFLKEDNRDKHVAAGLHSFPQGFSSVDKLIDIACTTGGLVAIGTHQNQKKTPGAATRAFESVTEDAPGALDANCFDAFHRKEESKAYQKPWKLSAELDRIFASRPKKSAEQACSIMKNAIDPEDGGLMFCYAKRGEFMAKSNPMYATWAGCSACGSKVCNCNGMLLSLEQITSAFSSRAKKEKKEARERGEIEQDFSAVRCYFMNLNQ